MKNHVRIIITCAVILMFFPFLGMSEFWEHLFVIIPSFIIAFFGVRLLRSITTLTEGSEADSLQEYIEMLQKRFKDQKKKTHHPHHSHELPEDDTN